MANKLPEMGKSGRNRKNGGNRKNGRNQIKQKNERVQKHKTSKKENIKPPKKDAIGPDNGPYRFSSAC